MRVSEYVRLDASEIARLTLAGEIGPGEVLDCAIAAIEAANPNLNAVVALYAEEAHAAIAAGLPRGPLFGVPVLLKDLGCPAIGTRTTHGSRLFADAPLWTHDCAFAERLRKAGAVILGRTHSCEFGLSLVTAPQAYGPTHNPFRQGLSPGGSSGGSAAAVASGMVPVAHATDGCGSIRVPASHCGLFGLKPSRGRISFGPDFGESWAGMSVNGALTRTVRDAALILDVVGVPYSGDPYCVPAPGKPFREQMALEHPRLRIGIVSGAALRDVDTECITAIRRAAELCGSLGHELVPVEPDWDLSPALEHLAVIWSTQLRVQLLARYQQVGSQPDGNAVEAMSWALAEKAAGFDAARYLSAVRYLHAFGRRLARSCEGVDVVLSPVTARPPWSVDELSMDSSDATGYLQELFRTCLYTVQYNISGWPAMSVPLHWTRDGLPIGVQFAGKLGEEAMLLALARELETAAPWRERLLGVAERLLTA